MTDVNSAFFQDYFLQVITASGMHQTGICQSSYGAQFRINKKGKPRLWLIVGHIAIQRRIPGTSQFVPHKSSLPLLYFYEHDIDRIPLLVFCVSVPIKDKEGDRVPDEPDISRRKKKLRQERGHLPGDPALQR